MILMVISSAGCSGGKKEKTEKNGAEEIKIDKVEVTLSKENGERLSVETDAATAVNQYLAARAYLDRFMQYDTETGNPEEYGQILSDAIAAFEAVEKTASALESTAGELEKKESDASYSGTDGSGTFNELCAEREKRFSLDPFALPAYASEESEAVKWAKDLTERFDKAPAGKGIRTLAEQMGTDAKHAYAQLKMAQDIISGAAYEDFAETANTAYKTAKVLKTAGTAAQLTLSIVTANPATVTEAVMTGGGILMNGLNTVLEVGQTASVLIVGEDNKLSESLENVENAIAPIGSAIGLYGLTSNLLKGAEFLKDAPAVADSVMYIGSSLNDYLSDGKILGGAFTQQADGTIKCTLAQTMTLKSAWAKPEQAGEVLKSVGYTEAEIKSLMDASLKAAAEGAAGTAGDLPADYIDAILEEWAENIPEEDSAEDTAADTAETTEIAVSADTEPATDVPEDTSGTEPAETDAEEQSEFPSVEEICGTYNISVHMEMGDQEADGVLIYTVKSPGGNTVELVDQDEYSMTGTYNPDTGKVVFTDSDGTPVNVSFTRTDAGGVKLKIAINAEYGSMNGSGTK